MHRERIAEIFQAERGRILATLIRLLGDIDVAEDALALAFEQALAQWEEAGIPEQPRAWLIRTARNKGVDQIRHQVMKERRREELAFVLEGDRPDDVAADEWAEPTALEDDRLRLIFTCCHPALALEAQVALTLRTLGGLSTEEIARAFLVPVATMAQRLVRAKQKIRVAAIPYRVPPEEELPERLGPVMSVVYLIFNEGYSASFGPTLLRADLAAEAIRLGHLACELLPRQPELRALLALLLLQDSRRLARVNPAGDLVLLEEQDRRLWNQEQIREGLAQLDRALQEGAHQSYTLQAAVAAIHARARTPEDTDWGQIAALYARLRAREDSPVIALNHAVAVAMRDGPEAGLSMLAALSRAGTLESYHHLPAARAALLVRLGRRREAAQAYREALPLVTNLAERRFLERRLQDLERDDEPTQ
ncbi:MAG: sigma factor-like helix-turn-helix DNA-binding protein [Myxococcales bacterium]